MKIVLSGLFYPLAMLRYFEAALKRRNDVELFTVGPYTGNWIPWNGGMNLPQKYATKPDLALPRMQEFVPISYVENQLPWKPDLWVQIDAGFHFNGKPVQGKNVIVGTDPHVLDYDQQRAFADTFYSMQTPYMKNGDKYLPYAYDPIWHAPDETQPQNYDVCLIGLHYEQRTQLVEALKAKGLRVYYDLGPCYEEARTLYNQAPIGLNWSSLDDLTARVFELLAMKRLAVVNRVSDLQTFFTPDEDLVVFDTHDEAIEKVLYYLDNPYDADEILESGHKRNMPNTWDSRVSQILGEAKWE